MRGSHLDGQYARQACQVKWSGDWELLYRLMQRREPLSQSEIGDSEIIRIRREYHPGSSIVAWTLSDEWTNRKPFEGTLARGHKVISDGRRFSLPDGATSGEIEASH